MMYGQITQIDYGSTDFSTYVAKRVPKFVLDQPNDRRKLRLAARPLAAPKTTARTSTRQTSWPDRRVKGVRHEN